MKMSNSDKAARILGSIKLAADNPSKLRKIDVYRVLADAQQQELLAEAAEFICKVRPELADEVRSCVDDLIPVEHCATSRADSHIQTIAESQKA